MHQGATIGVASSRAQNQRNCDHHHISREPTPCRMHTGSDPLRKVDDPARCMSKELAELAAELDRAASKVSLRKGAALFHCGDPLSGVFVVRKGAVTMSIDGGTAYPPRTIGPGEVAGLPATLTGHYSLSARVTEDAELGFIPGPKATEILECSPRLCMLAMRAMSEEIARVRYALRETPPLDWPETSDSESSSSQQTASD